MVPQRHAAGDCRFSGDVYRHVFTGSLLIEVMFSLNGLWLTGLRSDRLARLSCNVWYLVYFSPLIGLLLNIVSDISYTLVDPRIDFGGTLMSRLQPRQSGARWARFRHNRLGYWSLWIFLPLVWFEFVF